MCWGVGGGERKCGEVLGKVWKSVFGCGGRGRCGGRRNYGGGVRKCVGVWGT